MAVQGYAGNTQNVRSTDTVGLQSYTDMSGSANTLTHTFKPAGTSTLTVTIDSAGTPLSSLNRVSTTNTLNKFKFMSFNAKSESGDSIISKLYVQSGASSTAGLPATLYLCNDSDSTCAIPIASAAGVSIATGQSGFTNLSINVPVDTTKKFFIAGDMAATSSGATVASTSLPVNSVQWTKPDGSTASTTPGSALVSNDQYFYSAVPQYTLLDKSVTAGVESGSNVSTTTLTFKLKFKMTASGGQMVKPVVGDFILAISSSTATTTVTVAANSFYNGYSHMIGNAYAATTTNPIVGMMASTTLTLDGIDPTTDPAGDGGSYTFTLTGTIKNRNSNGLAPGGVPQTGGTNSAGNYRMILIAASSTVGGNQFIPQTAALNGFETPSAFLP